LRDDTENKRHKTEENRDDCANDKTEAPEDCGECRPLRLRFGWKVELLRTHKPSFMDEA